jgi:hypothetical protein
MLALWLKKIFTTEDTEVHRDAQGKMKRTFYECGFGCLVVFGIVFGILDLKTNAISRKTALRTDFAWPFAENEV